MEKIYEDSVFGKMTYNHRWYKQQRLTLFGKEWNITVVAKAYSGKPITKEQQDSYLKFCKNEIEIVNVIFDNLKKYINENIKMTEREWPGIKSIESAADLAQIVTPKTLLFKQDGTAIILLDCVWDEEHGIAVEFQPDVAVGSQDLFL